MDVFISNNFKGKNKLLDYQSTGVKFIFVLLPMFSLQDQFQNVLQYRRTFGINNPLPL